MSYIFRSQEFEIELLKDYDLTIKYHPGKANVVVDALMCLANDGSILVKLKAGQSQLKDARCNEIRERIKSDGVKNFSLGNEGKLHFMGRLYVPNEKGFEDLFWWPGMKREILEFVMKCLTFQRVKVKHQVLSSKFCSLEIPEWKWDRITMDFFLGLPLSASKKNFIWEIVDRLTKLAHFVVVHMNYSLEKLAKLYISEIVHLHGIPSSIVSDRYPRFTSRHLKEPSFGSVSPSIHKLMGNQKG
ncbi:integrase [Gossypium australe]|uniref:Integrase n=1 Tax=Gossypium australe TaxID=47621 RepID=A0A5B6VPY9_9ROSI|nr:integrase [Gossypium australe]